MASKNGSSDKRRKSRSSDQYSLNAAKLIDAAFAREVVLGINGKKIKGSTFLAIVLQLAQKALSNRRALRVLGRYTTYAAQNGGGRKVKIVCEPPTEKDQ